MPGRQEYRQIFFELKSYLWDLDFFGKESDGGTRSDSSPLVWRISFGIFYFWFFSYSWREFQFVGRLGAEQSTGKNWWIISNSGSLIFRSVIEEKKWTFHLTQNQITFEKRFRFLKPTSLLLVFTFVPFQCNTRGVLYPYTTAVLKMQLKTKWENRK